MTPLKELSCDPLMFSSGPSGTYKFKRMMYKASSEHKTILQKQGKLLNQDDDTSEVETDVYPGVLRKTLD